jgi:hypothetical protein
MSLIGLLCLTIERLIFFFELLFIFLQFVTFGCEFFKDSNSFTHVFLDR